jgi:hypothetical protein
MPPTNWSSIEAVIQKLESNISKVGDNEAPIFNMFLNKGKPTEQKKFEWSDHTLRSYKDEVVTAITSAGTTTLRVKSSATYGRRRYVVDTEAKSIISVSVDGNIEFMRVTALTEASTYTDLTVVRGHYSSTALASIPAGAQVIIEAATAGDGADITGNFAQLSTPSYNFAQYFHYPIALTTLAQEVKTLGNEASLPYQIALGSAEIMKMCQMAFFHGQRAEFTEDSKTVTKTGGLNWWANNAGNRINVGNQALTFKMIDDRLKVLLDNGVNANNIKLILPFTQQVTLNSMKEARVVGGGTSQGDKTITNAVQRYEFSDRASVDVMYSTDLRESEVFFVDKSRVTARPLTTKFFNKEELAKSGLSDKMFLYTHMGVEVRNPKETLFHIVNLAR